VEGVPEGHPRAVSLAARHVLVDGFKRGLVCEPGLIAQGRGEAFDYLLGERTNGFAKKAMEAAAATLLLGKSPVISVNGNMAAICPRGIVLLAREVGARIEANLFYRTDERVERVREALKEAGAREVLGGKGSGETKIPELFSERRRVSRKGIYSADVVLLALEDGDRTAALVRMKKKVIAIDLNPLSVTSQTATITVVDDISRAIPGICMAAERMRGKGRKELRAIAGGYDNKKNLGAALLAICRRMKELSKGMSRG